MSMPLSGNFRRGLTVLLVINTVSKCLFLIQTSLCPEMLKALKDAKKNKEDTQSSLSNTQEESSSSQNPPLRTESSILKKPASVSTQTINGQSSKDNVNNKKN